MRGKLDVIFLLLVFLIGIYFIISAFQHNPSTNATFNNEEKKVVSKEENALLKEEIVPTTIQLKSENGKIFDVPLSSIPPLEQYFKTEMDIKTELERMQVEPIDWKESKDQVFVLKYGCGNKICNLVLIKLNERKEVKITELTTGIFMDYEVFSNKSMFRIAVNEGSEVVKHQITAVDLKTMKPLHPLKESDQALYFSTPHYPITDFKWLSEDQVELTVANISDTTYESIDKWYKRTKPPVISVMISMER